MTNAKPNTKIFCVFCNVGETPILLGLGSLTKEALAPLPMVPSLIRAYHLVRYLIILLLAFANGASHHLV